MDTIDPQSAVPSADGISSTMIRRSVAAIGVGVLLIIVVFVWWYVGQKRAQQEQVQSAAELDSSLEAITATTSASVPTTENPLKSATPAVNPTEKTNPFNNEYQNPFQ